MGHFRSKLEFNVMNEELAFPRNRIPGEAYRFLSLDKDQVTYKRMLYVSGKRIHVTLPTDGTLNLVSSL